MNNEQNSFLQMCAAVKATVNAHQTTWSTYPAFATPYTAFLNTLAVTDEAIALQEKLSTGTTEQKALLREKLSVKLNQLTNALVQYSVETNNLHLRHDAYMSPSDINKLTEKAFMGHAVKLKALVPNPVPTSLSNPPVSINAAFMTELQTLMNDFTNAIGTPRHIVAESVRGTQELEKNIKLLREKLELMDIAANVLQYTQAAFYSEYTTSRALVDTGSSTRSLTVKVIDARTNNPIPDAQCTIQPGSIAKRTGEQGGFYIQSLEAGEYTLEVVKAGYTTVTKTFTMDEAGGLQIEVLL